MINNTEKEWLEKLTENRILAAQEIYQQRKGNNSQLTILECIQICDKKTILLKTESFLESFEYSKTRFKNLLENSESIRNELAHSQNSIIANLNWKDFVSTISELKDFLTKSEKTIRD